MVINGSIQMPFTMNEAELHFTLVGLILIF